MNQNPNHTQTKKNRKLGHMEMEVSFIVKIRPRLMNLQDLQVLPKSKILESYNKDTIERKQIECQDYHYSQSSKTSSLSRNIVFGIIGTCWVLIYANGSYHKPCLYIIITLGLSFVYLLLDLAHYFSDSCSYRNEYFRLERDKNTEGILYRHEEYMDGVSKRSFHLLIAKFICVLIIAVIFLIGILCQLEIF